MRSISKNSPVLITLAVTGVMLVTIAYLAYREHSVDTQDLINDMEDIPQTDSEVLRNVLSTEKGSMTSNEDHDKKVDEFVENLAINNMNKLRQVTNKSKVMVEVHNS